MRRPRRLLLWLVLAAIAGCGAKARRPANPPTGTRVAAQPSPDPFDPAALMADVRWLVAPERRGRGSFQPGARVAADYAARQFANAGLEVVRRDVPGGVDNVFGVIPGDERAVIVSAHYDHLGIDERGVVYPGADDNASGVAVLLALARAAAERDLEHTVLFAAFGAEEPGLVGSGAYIREPLWPLDRTVGVINFDMVGRRFFELGSGKPATAAVVGLEASDGVRAAAERAASAAGLELVATPARLLELFGFDDRTDDWWFRRRGVLAVHFSTSMHDDYHRPTDTAEKLVPAQMERVARTAFGVLVYLAGDGGAAGRRRRAHDFTIPSRSAAAPGSSRR